MERNEPEYKTVGQGGLGKENPCLGLEKVEGLKSPGLPVQGGDGPACGRKIPGGGRRTPREEGTNIGDNDYCQRGC